MAYSNVMRFTGLSGIDTASMVESMMKVESLKYDSLYKKSISYSYKQDAYQQVGNKLVDIQSDKFDILSSNSLRKTSTYVSNKSTVTDSSGNPSNAISITTGSGDQNFDGTVSVDQLASGDTWSVRGKEVGTTTAANSVGSLNETDGGSFDLTIDGVTKTITYSAADAAEFNSGDTDAKAAVLNRRVGSYFAVGSKDVKFGVNSDDPSKLTLSATAGHSAKISASAADSTSTAALGFNATTNSTAKTAENAKMGEMFWMVPGTSDTMTINGKVYSVGYDESAADFIKKVNDNDPSVKASYNAKSGNITISSRETGTANSIHVELGSGMEGTKTKTSVAQDAAVTIDGETFYSGTNDFDFGNGTKIKLNGTTTEPLHVKIEQDTAYTNAAVHDFVDTYNSLLQAIYDQTETSRPKSGNGAYYDPLTDEERAAMNASDLEKWDENSKKGLLYKDEDLRGIEAKLRKDIQTPVTLADGTKISLADLGVTLDSKDISKRGLLKVDDEKLNKAIDKYGADKIAAAFTTTGEGFAERVNTTLNQTVGTNGSLTLKVGLKSSPFSLVENPMSTRETQYARQLSDMLNMLAKKEDRYYAMFSNMETQIQKSNQQLASLG